MIPRLPTLLLVVSFSIAVPSLGAAQSPDDAPTSAASEAPTDEMPPVAPVIEPAAPTPPPDVAAPTIVAVEPAPAPQAPPEPASTTVPVSLTSADPRVLLHRADASAEGHGRFTFVCLLPCTAELAPGAYRFGATRSTDGDPRAISDVVEIAAAGEWNVRFSDNSGLRDGGWGLALAGAITTALGPVLGIVVFPKTLDSGFGRRSTVPNLELMLAFIFPGSAAMIVGMLLGVFSFDGVTVDEAGVRF